MSKYCVKCGSEINTLRGRLQTAMTKETETKVKILLEEKLRFHGQWEEPIKTKTTKMREKRAREKTLD